MTLAAVHVSPWLTVPVAALLAAVLVWYWMQLRSSEVPRSRRLIRRVSLVLSGLALVTATIGVSFVDPRSQQTAYVITWSIVILLIVLIMLTAVVDIFNSVRVQKEHRTRLAIDAAADLHRTIKDLERESKAPRIDAPTTNGSRGTHGAQP